MSELHRERPLERFSGLADLYAKYRPSYPDSALDFIIAHCGLASESLLVDIGSGTGISARLFAQRGIPVLGIEPNADMRRKAMSEKTPAECPKPEYREGTAEATGLQDSSVDVVLAAQAFHWFRSDPALREFQRVLKPGGWVVLMWNERDERDPFTRAYGDVFRTSGETAKVEGVRGQAGGALLTCPLFVAAERRDFIYSQSMDEDGLLGRALSASYAPRETEARGVFEAALRKLFAESQRDGQVVLHYVTSVYVARRE